MAMPLFRASNLRGLGLKFRALFLVAAAMILPGVGAGAGGLEIVNDARGPGVLIHGNYCGPGNRGPHVRPVDALDRACAHHDACWPTEPATLPACACNERLRVEAGLVARDSRTSPKTRETAELIATFAAAFPCDDGAGPRLPGLR